MYYENLQNDKFYSLIRTLLNQNFIQNNENTDIISSEFFLTIPIPKIIIYKFLIVCTLYNNIRHSHCLIFYNKIC